MKTIKDACTMIQTVFAAGTTAATVVNNTMTALEVYSAELVLDARQEAVLNIEDRRIELAKRKARTAEVLKGLSELKEIEL